MAEWVRLEVCSCVIEGH